MPRTQEQETKIAENLADEIIEDIQMHRGTSVVEILNRIRSWEKRISRDLDLDNHKRFGLKR